MIHMLTIGDEFLQFAIASDNIVTLVLVPFLICLFNVLNHSHYLVVSPHCLHAVLGFWCDKGNHHQGETWLA